MVVWVVRVGPRCACCACPASPVRLTCPVASSSAATSITDCLYGFLLMYHTVARVYLTYGVLRKLQVHLDSLSSLFLQNARLISSSSASGTGTNNWFRYTVPVNVWLASISSSACPGVVRYISSTHSLILKAHPTASLRLRAEAMVLLRLLMHTAASTRARSITHSDRSMSAFTTTDECQE